MNKTHRFPSIQFNAPVTLSFSLICLLALLLSKITSGASDQIVFGVYRAPLSDPLTYVRFFTHVFGHADWTHFMSNIMLVLVLGPLLEEKYGSAFIAVVIALTALVTGLVHFIFFPGVLLYGASGIVFAFILLSSFTSVQAGTIPLTLILVALIYIGREVYSIFLVRDNVSNLSHILGGGVGAVLGFFTIPFHKH